MILVVGAWALATTARDATAERKGAGPPATALGPREVIEAGERAMTHVDVAIAALARRDRPAALDALRRVQQTAAPPVPGALMPLTIQAKTLRDRLASGNPVDPRALRELARAVAAVQRR
jgi:hypothetical protein